MLFKVNNEVDKFELPNHRSCSLLSAEHTEDDLKFLLDLVQNDPEPRIRLELVYIGYILMYST